MKEQQKDNLHEINQYKDSSFPVGMYVITRNKVIPKGRGYMDIHWHEELQITLILEGAVDIQVKGRTYFLRQGEAICINKNLLHASTNITEDGKYASFNFPDKMLCFFSGSRMEQDDVLPFTNNPVFPVIIFRRGNPWQERVLDQLYEMYHFMREEDKDRYLLAVHIVSIWHSIIRNIGEQVKKPSRGYVRKQNRIQVMLSYIFEHYMEPIRLSDIAQAANISEGECCRCFQDMINQSPNQYLLTYRIDRSMELLNDTELSVAEIAFRTGFHDASHFIQYFKKKNGMTPKEYRMQNC